MKKLIGTMVLVAAMYAGAKTGGCNYVSEKVLPDKAAHYVTTAGDRLVAGIDAVVDYNKQKQTLSVAYDRAKTGIKERL